MGPMPYKAILFDLDGTLLDTLEDLRDGVNRILAKKGYPTHTLDAYRNFIGDGAAKLITRALPEDKRSDATISSCLEAFQNDYDLNWNVKTKPYAGVPEMLEALKVRGLKIAVLSNKLHDFTKRCVTALLSDWNFDAVLGHREGFPLKPGPSGALEVADHLRIRPTDFLFLGDSAVDMKTAIAAGMFPVGVLWGFRPAEELKESGAMVLIELPSDILNLLG